VRERPELGFQLGDRAGSGGLVEDLLLGGLQLVVGSVLEVFDVLLVQGRRLVRGDRDHLASALKDL
jgi:hypothetical protein